MLKVPNAHKTTDPYLVSIRPVLLKSAAECFVVLFGYFYFKSAEFGDSTLNFGTNEVKETLAIKGS